MSVQLNAKKKISSDRQSEVKKKKSKKASAKEKKTSSVFGRKIRELKDGVKICSNKADESLKMGAPKKIFGKNLICETNNRGKISDRKKFRKKASEGVDRKRLDKYCRWNKIKLTKSIDPKPYGGGNCQGAGFVFLQRWHQLPENKQNISGMKAIAQKFEGGMPVEGVTAQAIYVAINDSNTDKNGRISGQAQTDMYKTLALYHDMRVEELEVINGSPTEALAFIEKCDPGTYLITMPSYGSFGGLDGHHAVAFIKDDEGNSYLYDPNYGIGFDDQKRPQEMVERDFRYYVGDIRKNGETKSKVHLAGRRVKNIFASEANAPLKGVSNGFNIIRMGSRIS